MVSSPFIILTYCLLLAIAFLLLIHSSLSHSNIAITISFCSLSQHHLLYCLCHCLIVLASFAHLLPPFKSSLTTIIDIITIHSFSLSMLFMATVSCCHL